MESEIDKALSETAKTLDAQSSKATQGYERRKTDRCINNSVFWEEEHKQIMLTLPISTLSEHCLVNGRDLSLYNEASILHRKRTILHGFYLPYLTAAVSF